MEIGTPASRRILQETDFAVDVYGGIAGHFVVHPRDAPARLLARRRVALCDRATHHRKGASPHSAHAVGAVARRRDGRAHGRRAPS